MDLIQTGPRASSQGQFAGVPHAAHASDYAPGPTLHALCSMSRSLFGACDVRVWHGANAECGTCARPALCWFQHTRMVCEPALDWFQSQHRGPVWHMTRCMPQTSSLCHVQHLYYQVHASHAAHTKFPLFYLAPFPPGLFLVVSWPGVPGAPRIPCWARWDTGPT